MTAPRRFPPPWSVEELTESFVKRANIASAPRTSPGRDKGYLGNFFKAAAMSAKVGLP